MRYLFMVMMMFFASYITAQTNPSSIDLKIIKGEPFTASLIGSDIELVAGHSNSIVSEQVTNPDKNTWDIVFLSDQIGTYSAVFKYSENGKVFYTTFLVSVVESIISLTQDYQEINQGEVAIIDVVSNDNSSGGGLQVTSIPYVQNGAAEILGGFIEYTPEPDFSGLAYLNYVVTDSMGESETGFVTINVTSAPLSDPNGQVADRSRGPILNQYFVQIGEQLDIVIPSSMNRDNFGSTTFGKLNTLGVGVLRYKANKKTGVENVSFNADGKSHSFEIHVFDKKENHGFIRDDVIYATMGESVQFDVFANDLEKNFVLIDKSPELKLVSPNSGELVYNAPQGYQGSQHFYYEVSDGNSSYIGNIEIVINDDLPQTRVYEFVTRENTPFLLEHSSISNGSLQFSQAPVNGVLRTQENGFFYCGGKVQGQNFMVYDPSDGFVGEDEFEVEYCSEGGSCVTLEIIMTVESSNNECNCIGEECVWPGDADGDGIVSVKDLLPIGYYIGESGAARNEEGNDWNAMNAENWNVSQENGGIDIKNVDGNGDGQIDSKDVEILNDNFNKIHSLLSSEALSIKDVPFYAVPRAKSGIAGDLILIDLFVGTVDNPLLESNGLAFNFTIPPSYIEKNSLSFTFNPSAWYGYNNPTINTVQYPNGGRVEAAISRTGGQANDGFGVLGTFQFIFMEDIDGVKPEGYQLPIEIEINGGEYINGTGKKYGLESSKTTIYLDLETEKVDPEIEIITYPNPVDQTLNIHANNQDEIQIISLYNTIGQTMGTYSDIQSNHFEINTSQLPQGFYMARVETTLGVSVEKVQVVRQ